jgi:hypothetical protein
MPLLGAMFRSQAIYGTTDTFGSRLAGRQGGDWARRTVGAAIPHPHPLPPARPGSLAGPASPEAQAELADLHRRGVISDAELASLSARYR